MSDIDREAAARAATPGPWFEDDPGDGNRLFVGNRADGRTHGLWQTVYMSADRMCDLTPEAERRIRADARHIAANDPATILADIERMRRLEAVKEAAREWAEWRTRNGIHFASAHERGIIDALKEVDDE